MLARIQGQLPSLKNVEPAEVLAFALDLDSDGKDEIVFSVSNLERLSQPNEKTGRAHQYSVLGGILAGAHDALQTFFAESGEYVG